jgi:hypothetical protein
MCLCCNNSVNLYSTPNGMERFRHYLSVMTNPKGDGLVFPPLALINPMGKEHLNQRLDELLAIHADERAQASVANLQYRTSRYPRATIT